ncbi:MAG: cell wall-binding repeat-containing protein [Euzebya sp.]
MSNSRLSRTVSSVGVTSVASALLIAVLALPALAQPPRTQVQGGSPAQDAVGWSQLSFAGGAAPVVLIATDADFADALSAGAVQGLLQAPLLLTPPETLDPATAAEIARLGADQAVIFGGEDAISPAVDAELQALGLQTERVQGQTRLETAVATQQRFFPDATAAVLARAFGSESDPTQAFADTVSVGAYTSVANTPVLLTDTDSLSAPTAAALSASAIDSVMIVGGSLAVSDGVASAVAGITTRGSTESTPGITVNRLAGNSRFDTAVAINRDLGYATAADSPRVFLVEGQADDAWTGGLPAAVQAGNSASVVLANGDFLLTPTFDFLFNADVPLICGPNVTAVACDKAFAALQGMGEADMPAPEEESPPGLLDPIIDLLPIDLPIGVP